VRNYAEKSINAVLTLVALAPAAEACGQVAAFYEATLSTLSGAGNERLILNTRLKQARLLLSMGHLAELRDYLADLATCIGEGSDHSTVLLEVYCLQLQVFSQLGDGKRVLELVARARAVAQSAVALPAVYGVMHESSGRVAMLSKRWDEAEKEFREAFKSFEGSPKAIPNFNLFLLAKMLGSSRVDPFQDESARSYLKVAEVEDMVELMKSYLPSLDGDTKGLRKCVTIINKIKRSADSDQFIVGYLGALLFSIQGNVALDLLAPYSAVTVKFVAEELGACGGLGGGERDGGGGRASCYSNDFYTPPTPQTLILPRLRRCWLTCLWMGGCPRMRRLTRLRACFRCAAPTAPRPSSASSRLPSAFRASTRRW
jgi:hypothetical protein